MICKSGPSTVTIITSTLDLLAVKPHFTRPARCAAAAAIGRYLLPAPDLSSKPASRRCCCQSTGQTDRRADGSALDQFMTLADADSVTTSHHDNGHHDNSKHHFPYSSLFPTGLPTFILACLSFHSFPQTLQH